MKQPLFAARSSPRDEDVCPSRLPSGQNVGGVWKHSDAPRLWQTPKAGEEHALAARPGPPRRVQPANEPVRRAPSPHPTRLPACHPAGRHRTF